MSPVAWSQTLPDSGTVVSGAATSDLDLGGVMNPGGGGTAMTITQTSPSAIINWYSFDVATGSTLTFAQPVGGVILNRVIGDGFTPITPSLINGIINGNGNVFIINPTGILFGSGSQVNVGGLVASTLDISDTDFNNGAAMPDPHYIFTTPSAPGGAIVNRGSLIAASGGTIALLAARIENQGLGTITAQDGSVVLGAGQSMNLDFYDDGLTTVTLTANGYDLDPGCASSPVPTSSCLGGIENSGTITADGGHIEMRTTTTDGLPSAATLFTEAANGGRIWIGGSVIANTTASRAGSIILDAGMGNIDIGGI
ncbi:MAG: filamentous hemagglutinin N-terminal domain-containing protein, partial [Proteobacteria bacterium]|nr:filamentous hemagglutinin N-terminal domain-containing protein [Pseudomonadota bacterium]